MSVTSWDSSANTYSREVEQISFYHATNQELISTAKIQAGMTIVDLACGTGFTTRTILEAIGSSLTIYGIERSYEMLRQAQRAIKADNVQFIQRDAEDFASSIPRPVDRVVCNAAFFLFANIGTVLDEIRTILKPKGLFAFNIPDQEYDFGDGKSSEMAYVANKYLDPCLSMTAPETPRYSSSKIHSLASTHGFRVSDFTVIGLHLSVDDLINFYSIPYIGARRFPNQTPEELKEVVTGRFQMLSEVDVPYYRWAQFVCSSES